MPRRVATPLGSTTRTPPLLTLRAPNRPFTVPRYALGASERSSVGVAQSPTRAPLTPAKACPFLVGELTLLSQELGLTPLPLLEALSVAESRHEPKPVGFVDR